MRPGGNGDTIVIKINHKILVDHDKDYYNSNVNYNLFNLSDNINQYIDSGEEFTVIVAYTAEFANAAGDIGAYMNLLELETNQSYINSQVNTQVKIIHSYQTNYADTGDFYTDRDYFSDVNNPEAKKLYDLRDQFNADIMIILTGNAYNFCGLAKEIGATENNAFAFARENCATGYYSFAHEIGHLFGARHIISTDSNNYPFPFGHGYCNITADTWRTVMAYNCSVETGGPRIQQWSNPNIDINGETTGTFDLEFNAKVLNIRAEEVANFRHSSQLLLELAWLIPMINHILL